MPGLPPKKEAIICVFWVILFWNSTTPLHNASFDDRECVSGLWTNCHPLNRIQPLPKGDPSDTVWREGDPSEKHCRLVLWSDKRWLHQGIAEPCKCACDWSVRKLRKIFRIKKLMARRPNQLWWKKRLLRRHCHCATSWNRLQFSEEYPKRWTLT